MTRSEFAALKAQRWFDSAVIGMACAPSAAADVTTTPLGSEAKLVDGSVVQGWTVKELKPSTDVIPHPVRGMLSLRSRATWLAPSPSSVSR